MIAFLDQPPRQPGRLGVLPTIVAKEARTRGFASRAFARFALIVREIVQ